MQVNDRACNIWILPVAAIYSFLLDVLLFASFWCDALNACSSSIRVVRF